MPSFFEIAILKLKAFGFFKFLLPFILTAAIIYGLLRKSQLFGEPDKNVAVNATIAFTVSLFVWAAPIILGIDIERNLAAFWIQGLSVSLIIIVGLMLASMFFPPDLAKQLTEHMKGKNWFWAGLIIVGIFVGGVLLLTSGLYVVLFPKGTGVALSSDIFITLGVLIILGLIIGWIAQVGK